MGEISKKVQESRLKLYEQSVSIHIEKTIRIRKQESDGGAGEKKERKTKAEIVG